MKNLSKWLLAAAVGAMAIGFVPHALHSWHYATSDEISRMQLDTERVLDNYERSGDADELSRWLAIGSFGEALSTQFSSSFGNWAQEHPEQFTTLMEELAPAQREKLICDFCSLYDGLATFQKKFVDSPSPTIQKMRECACSPGSSFASSTKPSSH